MHVDKALALVRSSEELLGQAFLLLADRHGRDRDVRDVSRALAGWSRRHEESLAPFVERYGRALAEQPERVRSALFRGQRLGELGLLRDEQDTLLLAQQAQSSWRALQEAAGALGDAELVRVCEQAADHTDRQIAWLDEQVRLRAPGALTGREPWRARLRSALPLRGSAQALPEVLWAPLAAGLALAVVAVVALALGLPLLLPSLGPSAYLLGTQAPHPSTRAYNTVVGHALGLLAGFAAVTLLGATDAPAVLPSGGLTAARAAAAVLAVSLTLLAVVALRARHPPAATTALMVALGWVRTWHEASVLLGGVAVLAAVGALLRWARTGRSRALQEAREGRAPQAT